MTETYCLNCGEEIQQTRTGRTRKFCPGTSCRVAYHRRKKRYIEARENVTKVPDLSGVLVLELFPGAGLFGRAFSELGATVVNAGDIMHGYDIRAFEGIQGRFDGIIGGPPCQFASKAAVTGTDSINLIPEFVRVVEDCEPDWAVMENVREARPYAPSWDYVSLRDWDCGGRTHRRRGFWFYGAYAPIPPRTRPGKPDYSVLASSWNSRGESDWFIGSQHDAIAPQRASDLQGYPALARMIIENQPGWLRKNGMWNGVSKRAREIIAIHLLGNGVPSAMGRYVAEWVAVSVYGAKSPSLSMQLPLLRPDT